MNRNLQAIIQFTLLCATFLPSCKSEPESLQILDYINWVEAEENQLTSSKQIEDLLIRVKFQPLDYLALKESKNLQIDPKELERIKENFDGYEHYSLEFGFDDSNEDYLKLVTSSYEEYQYMVHYFSYDLKNDIFLVNGEDTLPCILHHFERTYNLQPLKKVNLVFESKNIHGKHSLLLDGQIFDLDFLEFKFDEHFISSIPNLKEI